MSKLQDTAGPTFYISDKTYATSIERDRPREAKQAANAASQECFACGRSFCKGDGRFCSTRCRDGFDAGLPPYQEIRASYSLTPRGDGFAIECAACRREFISKGLRCCSFECERKLRERKEIAASIAEAGIEQPTARAKCEKCGNNIPRWTGAGTRKRATPKGTRFCGRKCREAA
jgi:DNA-directed RNA polymerase subunit M/transcription elongation factor TFIIS